MENKKTIWKRWYMICLYVFIGLIVLVSILPDTKEVNTEIIKDNSNPTNLNNELIYLETMQKYTSLFIVNSELISETLIATSTGEISISDCSMLIGLSNDNYKLLEQGLRNMNVPVKYNNVHQHMLKAAGYMTDATSLLSKDCGNINYINQATDMVYLSIDELDKANALLNKHL